MTLCIFKVIFLLECQKGNNATVSCLYAAQRRCPSITLAGIQGSGVCRGLQAWSGQSRREVGKHLPPLPQDWKPEFFDKAAPLPGTPGVPEHSAGGVLMENHRLNPVHGGLSPLHETGREGGTGHQALCLLPGRAG